VCHAGAEQGSTSSKIIAGMPVLQAATKFQTLKCSHLWPTQPHQTLWGYQRAPSQKIIPPGILVAVEGGRPSLAKKNPERPH
jgi:hypothetical protein